MATTSPICWICGNPADSREHKSQKSDLKAVLGTPSQSKPFFLHSETQKNRKIPGLKSGLTMFDKSLCQDCNNSLTQPHDRAWQQLSHALRTRLPAIAPGQIIPCNRVFPYMTAEEMLNVHLFFCKKFGCHIIDANIVEIDSKGFANAIKSGEPHPNMFLSFGATPKDDELPDMVATTDMQMAKLPDGRCMFAVWGYVVDGLTVHVMYAIPGEKRDGLIDSWHPSNSKRKHLRIKQI
jgi:hypothetical protein